MIRLGEEEPAFEKQADVLHDEGEHQKAGAVLRQTGPEQQQRDRENQDQKDPFH